MGFSISWLAVRTDDNALLFAEAQVAPTSQPDTAFESPLAGAALAGGWYLLVAQEEHRLVGRESLARLSTRWPCVACSIEEHVMFSSATAWEAGSQLWFVSHDAQRGIFDLEWSGKMPDSFAEIRARSVEEQQAAGGSAADVDLMFDIPLLLAREITGFKHDEASPAAQTTPVAFHDRNVASSRRRSGWKLWLSL